MKITLQPHVLKWARKRTGISVDDLALKFSARQPETWKIKIEEWEASGELTLSQAETLAKKTHTPFGQLFLAAPPLEALPVADFRTVGSQAVVSTISPELIETLDSAIVRQQWYRDYEISLGQPILDYVGSMQQDENIENAAFRIRDRFGLGTELRTNAATAEIALKNMRENIAGQGVLVMHSSYVGESTKRALNVSEFRGFALSDEFAPLIFINSRDYPAAQIFTLLHELVHIWLGISGVSNLSQTYAPDRECEKFCNAVAAEILVPGHELRVLVKEYIDIEALIHHFKVSSLVIIRRLRDLGVIDVQDFDRRYGEAVAGFQALRERRSETGGGGDPYRNKISRFGNRFLSAVIEWEIEGRVSTREAYRLLGVCKTETYQRLARRLEFEV